MSGFEEAVTLMREGMKAGREGIGDKTYSKKRIPGANITQSQLISDITTAVFYHYSW